MANTNLNNNTNTARRSVSPFPTADLSFKWLGAYDGNDLLNVLGANPTYVSGSGLDAIYDFSVLSDDRFDKGAIVGNALGLPEYYNDPLNAYFYYDATSETTRRYWKLKDFHYFYLQQQTDITPRLLNNWAFLKAKATSDTSNEIDTIQSLHIYSTEQITTLPKLKTLIGLQADFYGDNVIVSDLLNSFDPTRAYTTFTGNGKTGFSVTNDGTHRAAAGTADEINIVEATLYLVTFNLSYTSGILPDILFRNNINFGTSRSNFVISTVGLNNIELTITSSTTAALSIENTGSVLANYSISDLEIKISYINYYKS